MKRTLRKIHEGGHGPVFHSRDPLRSDPLHHPSATYTERHISPLYDSAGYSLCRVSHPAVYCYDAMPQYVVLYPPSAAIAHHC